MSVVSVDRRSEISTFSKHKYVIPVRKPFSASDIDQPKRIRYFQWISSHGKTFRHDRRLELSFKKFYLGSETNRDLCSVACLFMVDWNGYAQRSKLLRKVFKIKNKANNLLLERSVLKWKSTKTKYVSEIVWSVAAYSTKKYDQQKTIGVHCL